MFASGTAIVISGSEAIIHTTCRQQVRLFIKFPPGPIHELGSVASRARTSRRSPFCHSCARSAASSILSHEYFGLTRSFRIRDAGPRTGNYHRDLESRN